MKKILLLFICIFLITGCDVEYNLMIENGNVNEQIILPFSKQNFAYENVTDYLNNKITITNDRYENKYYDMSLVTTSDFYNLIYKYNFDFEGFKKSFFVDICFPNMKITENDGEIIIASGKNFKCLNPDNGVIADSVKINVKTDLKVLDNNADNVTNNIYTWNINYDNYQTKELNLRLKKDEIKKENNFSFVIYIIIFVVIAICMILLFVKKKFDGINNID